MRKLSDGRRTDGQTDRQTDKSDSIGRCPTNVEGPKLLNFLANVFSSITFFSSITVPRGSFLILNLDFQIISVITSQIFLILFSYLSDLSSKIFKISSSVFLIMFVVSCIFLHWFCFFFSGAFRINLVFF